MNVLCALTRAACALPRAATAGEPRALLLPGSKNARGSPAVAALGRAQAALVNAHRTFTRIYQTCEPDQRRDVVEVAFKYLASARLQVAVP